MEEILTLKFKAPLFGLLLTDCSGAVWLQAEGLPEHCWIPIFTSLEFAELYVQRCKMDCLIVELPTWRVVVDFLLHPPCFPSSPPPSDRLVIDPIGNQIGDSSFGVGSRVELANAIAEYLKHIGEPL